MALVQVVKTSKIRDQFLGACVRNIWFLSATWDIKLDIYHIPGKDNSIADLLTNLYSLDPVNSKLLPHLHTNYIWNNIPLKFFNIDMNI